MYIKIFAISVSVAVSLSACGGGGGGDSTSAPAPTANFATLVVNKNGLYRTATFSTSTNYVQNATTGYFVSPYINQEWTGSNLGYTSGYVNPTSGRLYTYRVTDRTNSELWWAITDLNYDISGTAASNDSSILPLAALAAATETKISGGSNNDQSLFLMNTSEVDLGAGNDTLILSQNYSVYQFTRYTGSTTNIYVARDGHQTLVKNVESFQFANTTKTLSEILATIP